MISIVQEDSSGRTALHWASIAGHTTVVQMLLGKGANIIAATKTGMNPLHCAVQGAKVETVRALMEFCREKDDVKASLTNAKNSDGKLPWDIALSEKNQAVCQVLKDMGDANGASSSCFIS